jgi:hypothetical protein
MPNIMPNFTNGWHVATQNFGVIGRAQTKNLTAIGHVMLRHAPHGVIAGVNPHMRSDRNKLTNIAIDNVHIPSSITIVAKGGFNDATVGKDFCPCPYVTIHDEDIIMEEGG